MASPPSLGPQFHGFEPVDVSTVEEHKPDSADSLVDLEGVAGEDGPLDDNSIWIIVEETPSSQQRELAVTLFCEHEDRGGGEGDGSEGGHDDDSVPEVSLVLVFAAVGVLAEDGTGGKPPPADLEDQPGLGLDGERAREGMSPHGNVYHGHSVLVRQETCDHQTRAEVALKVSAHSTDDESDVPAGFRSAH